MGMHNMNLQRRLSIGPILIMLAAFPSLPAQTAPAGDAWPMQLDNNGFHIVIYQPQVDSWKQNRLEGRAAVTATKANLEAFGIVTLSARTDVDKETRMVALEDLKVVNASFPGAKPEQGDLSKAISESLPTWPKVVALDRLLADLSVSGASAEAMKNEPGLKNDPPKIIVSQVSSVLVLIDGEPVLKPVEGSTKYTRVINTPALMLYDTSASRYYLDGGTVWMTSANLTGPWIQAPTPPADLNALKTQLLAAEDKDPHDHSNDPPPPPKGPPAKGGDAASSAPPPVTGAPAAVYVSTTPAELVQINGRPRYTPIPKTELTYVMNTSTDLFRDVKTQDFYVLLTGRWYQAKALEGPWSALSGSKLPKDFTKIPPESPEAAVLASIPGTEQAKEAVIANQIPQTATVKRKEAKLTVTYDGAPQFRPIEGTSMEYAVNTSTDVIHAAGRYYAVHDGIWFISDIATGPWAVADNIPPEIYAIPPSNPLYRDRFVYVYGYNPDVVYVGYTPGYLGAYVWDDTVVFGTGWWYPGWEGAYWYGWPWTWGFGFQFGYFGGGWIWRPNGFWWYHNGPFLDRVYSEHWNTHWAPGDSERLRNNVNVYNRWGGNTVAARNLQPSAGATRLSTSSASRRDLYAGRDGKVYERQNNTWTQHDNTNGTTKKVQPPQDVRQQQQSRSFGESRTSDFGRSGISQGFPRSAPSFGGGGGFHGGGHR
jgi:hypothetical protein